MVDVFRARMEEELATPCWCVITSLLGNVLISYFLFLVFQFLVPSFFRTRNKNVFDNYFCFLFEKKRNRNKKWFVNCVLFIDFLWDSFFILFTFNSIKHQTKICSPLNIKKKKKLSNLDRKVSFNLMENEMKIGIWRTKPTRGRRKPTMKRRTETHDKNSRLKQKSSKNS